MLTEREIEDFRAELMHCKNPLFFFDDDMDGTASFLLLYRLIKEGRGIIVKSTPELSPVFLQNVENFGPDKVFILDKPLVSQEFIDGCKQKIFWLDHHPLQQPQKARYFNPRRENSDDNRPTSYWCYKIANKKEDLWIAMLGIVGDWYMPEFRQEFSEKYPDILPPSVKTVEEALYNSPFGKLFKIFSFNLKGTSREAYSSIKIMTRLTNPYEVMNQTTTQGRFLYKKYEKVNVQYEALLKEIPVDSGKILFFSYTENKMSFTSDLSNELLVRYPEKFIIIARQKDGEMKCSMRSATIKVLPILERALVGINGYGGGHDYACGGCIKVEDWERFKENLRREIEK
jgi:hypothetical protein